MLQARSAVVEISASHAAGAVLQIERPSVRLLRLLRRALLAALMTAACLAGLARAQAWYRSTVVSSRAPIAALELYPLLFDTRPLIVPVAAGGEVAHWRTTDEELVASPVLWRRLHLAQWNSVPADLRERALDNMFARYGHVLLNPRQWDTMGPDDWDEIPQPMRIAAFRHMLAYWAGYYHVGAEYHLPPRLVADTLAAIVMSESWFDYRAVVVNRHGNADIGLGQASDFARERLRELHAAGRVDVGLADEDYYDPWRATRFVALWMRLLLDEAGGDLPTAIRAYHRGIRSANGPLGMAYGEIVQQRLTRYIRNQGASDAWRYFWQQSEAMSRQHWPWLVKAQAADASTGGPLGVAATIRGADINRPRGDPARRE